MQRILILKKSIGFQKSVTDYKNINFEEIYWFQKYIPVSDDNTYCLTKRFVKDIYMVSL